MKHITITILNHIGEYIGYSVRKIDCPMMNRGQHRSVENLLSFCAGCGIMQDCKPWTKVDDIPREDFEKAKNENELFEELEAL